MSISIEEKNLFDQQGYLILRQVLTPEELRELNAVSDRKVQPDPAAPPSQRREFFICEWGAPFLRLVDHPRIVPYLEELVSPKFRLDHDYCIFMDEGCPGTRLHGGEREFKDFWYSKGADGKVCAGLTVVTYFLSDAAEGDGGFGFIPGSHKEPLLYELPEDVVHFRNIPSYVQQPGFKAGDVVIFAESMVHGTMPWQGKHERRVLLYKYCPGHMAWIGDFYDTSKFANLTEQQKRIMAPPYVDRIVQPNGRYRPNTLVR